MLFNYGIGIFEWYITLIERAGTGVYCICRIKELKMQSFEDA